MYNHLREDKESKEEIHAEEVESVEEQERKYNEKKTETVKHVIGDIEFFLQRPCEEWGCGENDEYILIDFMACLDNTVKAYLSKNIRDYQG